MELNNREMVKAEFAKRLYQAILERGWSQSEFARHCGLNRDAISTYVRAKSFPSPQALKAMAGVLNMTPEQLMPNYYEAAADKVEPILEIKELPGAEGYMWLKLNMRLPKAVAMKIFMLAQESR
ncbi:MAG: hypothetical protein PWQ61_3010 [Betaproteobacteria bacterium]|nr:hypothetical protein [Betaproteobacteria bacterium]